MAKMFQQLQKGNKNVERGLNNFEKMRGWKIEHIEMPSNVGCFNLEIMNHAISQSYTIMAELKTSVSQQ